MSNREVKLVKRGQRGYNKDVQMKCSVRDFDGKIVKIDILARDVAPAGATYVKAMESAADYAREIFKDRLVGVECNEVEDIKKGNESPCDKNDTLCWKCQNAVPKVKGGRYITGCEWSIRLKPVDEWIAISNRRKLRKRQEGIGYCVLLCPKFKREAPRKNIRIKRNVM